MELLPGAFTLIVAIVLFGGLAYEHLAHRASDGVRVATGVAAAIMAVLCLVELLY